MKKISLAFICIILIISTVTVSAVEPRWSNTRWVTLYHEYINGDAHCEIEIRGFSGTTKIDNVDVELYKSDQNCLLLVKCWENLYVNESVFYFYEIVENVEPGYEYRLSVSADVHRNGTVESISEYHDVQY